MLQDDIIYYDDDLSWGNLQVKKVTMGFHVLSIFKKRYEEIMAKKSVKTRQRFSDDKKAKAIADVKALVAKGMSQNQACKKVSDKLGTSSVTVYSWLKGPAKKATKGAKGTKKATRKKTVDTACCIHDSLVDKISECLSDERLLEIVLEECVCDT